MNWKNNMIPTIKKRKRKSYNKAAWHNIDYFVTIN